MLTDYNFLKWCIVCASFYALIWEILEAIRIRKLGGKIWGLKIGFALTSLYWMIYFIIAIIRNCETIICQDSWQVLITGPILITIMLIGASASASWYRHRKSK